MNEGLIPARYAKALYLVGCEKHVDKDLYDKMKALDHAFETEPKLHEVLANPFISAADKQKLMATAVGSSSSDTVFSDFLKLLSRNRRLDMARSIANAYVKLYRHEHNIYNVKVVSAAPLSDDDSNRLKNIIGSHLNGGSMEYSTAVDPALIGGFTVNVGNERLDASISNELKQLRLNLISK